MNTESFRFKNDGSEISELVRQAVVQDTVAGQLDTDLSQQYLNALELGWVKAGQPVMRQGGSSDNLATVIFGRVRVVREAESGESETLITLGHGQTVGEMGLVTGQPRSATVIAQRDTLLATLSRSAFEQLLEKNPIAFNHQFVRPIINRLQDQLNGITKVNVSLLSMVLIPASKSVNVQSLATQLTATLNKGIASCLHIDHHYLSKNLGNVDESDAKQDRRISAWLGMQEAKHDVVIYTAGHADSLQSPWLKRCLRQSDKIIIVGDGVTKPVSAESLPALTMLEAAQQERFLLLLHADNNKPPQGTIHWLNKFDTKYFYHLCFDSIKSTERVARLLANRGIGVVYRGSGARGIAHIGATKLLQERGVPFDVVCGSSSGSIVSTGIAAGWDIETFKKHADNPPKIQYTIPFSAVSTGFGMQKWLDNMHGERHLEDIWITNFFPLYNMSTSELEICDRGRVSHYLRAATALPGMFPPFIDGSNVYLDGGVVNFMPIDLMRERSDIQTVIAVDIHSPLRNKNGPTVYSYDGRISGFKVLLNRFNPFAKQPRFVGIARALLGTLFVAGIQSNRRSKHLADFRINMVVTEEDIGMLDFDKTEQAAQYGYEEASRQFAESGLEAHFAKASAYMNGADLSG